MTHTVILSPHPDDAPLSLGGWIHRHARQGERVTIVTAMGGDPDLPLPDSPIVRELHERWQAGSLPSELRRAEDSEAARNLGAQIAFLPLADCIYRTDRAGTAMYQTEESLFGMPHPDDPALPVPDLLRGLLAEADRVIAPLTIGGHVDHRIVHAWVIALWQSDVPWSLVYYTDYPYAEDAEAVRTALDRVALDLKPEAFMLMESDVRAKMKSMACYRSQVSTFWPSVEAMEAAIYAYMTGNGKHDPSEIVWHPQRRPA